MNTEVSAKEKAAIERLLQIAQGDTGQSRRVANLLLAWWNAEECGGFDLTDLWNVDSEIAADMVALIAAIAGTHSYPDTLGFGKEFEDLSRRWRRVKQNQGASGE